MLKVIRQPLNKIGVVIPSHIKAAIILLSFVCTKPLAAAQQIERRLDASTTRLATLSLQDSGQVYDSLASSKKQDAFSWQNTKHYESIVKIFESLANRELISVINGLIRSVNEEHEFFNRTYQFLISKQQERIHSWMLEHVLTRANYLEETTSTQTISDPDTSEYSDEDESWGRMYIRG